MLIGFSTKSSFFDCSWQVRPMHHALSCIQNPIVIREIYHGLYNIMWRRRPASVCGYFEIPACTWALTPIQLRGVDGWCAALSGAHNAGRLHGCAPHALLHCARSESDAASLCALYAAVPRSHSFLRGVYFIEFFCTIHESFMDWSLLEHTPYSRLFCLWFWTQLKSPD